MIVSVALASFLAVVSLYKIRFCGLSSFNSDYLSIQSTLTVKGLFALCIVACHTFGTAVLSVGRLYGFAISAFFFISGYGLMYGYMHKQNYLHGFIRKRLSSLLIPFLIAAVVYLPVKLKAGLMPERIIDVFIGKSLFVSFSWFVFAILLFYFVFYLIFRFVRNKTIIIILLVAAMFAYPTAMYFLHYEMFWYENFASFFVGIFWCWKKNFLDKLLREHLIACFAALLLLYAATYAMLPITYRIFNFYPEALAYNIRYSAGILIFIIMLTRVRIGNAVTVFLGKISYELYLIHGVFLILFNEILSNINKTAMYALVFICSVAGAWLLNLLNNSINKHIKGRDKL